MVVSDSIAVVKELQFSTASCEHYQLLKSSAFVNELKPKRHKHCVASLTPSTNDVRSSTSFAEKQFVELPLPSW